MKTFKSAITASKQISEAKISSVVEKAEAAIILQKDQAE